MPPRYGENTLKTTVEEMRDNNGKVVVTKTKTTKKVRPPDWCAAAFLLERHFPEQWRLDRPVEKPQTANTPQADLLVIDVAALGMVLPVK